MTSARRIVERLIAKKIPNMGRYLFEVEELVEIIQAVQKDANTPTWQAPKRVRKGSGK